MQPARLDLPVIPGATLNQPLLLMQPVYQYRPITGLAGTAPVRLQVPAHGLPGDWLVWCEGVPNWPDLNQDKARSPGRLAHVVDPDTLEFNDLAGQGRTAASGLLVYRLPVDLTGCEIRAEIRGEGAAPILLTQGNDGVLLQGLGRVLLILTAEQTAAISWARGEWDLTITHPDGTVNRWVAGQVLANSGGGCAHGC